MRDSANEYASHFLFAFVLRTATRSAANVAEVASQNPLIMRIHDASEEKKITELAHVSYRVTETREPGKRLLAHLSIYTLQSRA